MLRKLDSIVHVVDYEALLSKCLRKVHLLLIHLDMNIRITTTLYVEFSLGPCLLFSFSILFLSLHMLRFYAVLQVDCFHVLRKSDPPFVPASILIKQGLASFVCQMDFPMSFHVHLFCFSICHAFLC